MTKTTEIIIGLLVSGHVPVAMHAGPSCGLIAESASTTFQVLVFTQWPGTLARSRLVGLGLFSFTVRVVMPWLRIARLDPPISAKAI